MAILALTVAAAAPLVAGWILYPLALRLAPRRAPTPNAGVPSRSLGAVIVTRDDPWVLSRRVDNLLASEGVAFDEILVVLDWAVRDRLDGIESLLAPRARVIVGDAPGGKAAGLNAGIRTCTAEWVLLADSWQIFEPCAVHRLLEGISDARCAAVSGRVAHDHDDAVMALYWRYENAIREAQSARHGIVTTSGAITLVRRAAIRPLPAGAICDDLFITLDLAMTGYRVAYAPDAIARDPRSLTRDQLFQKKVRTLTGLWQLLAWKPAVLVPWRNPLFLDFAFHKLARLATPYLVLLCVAVAAVPIAGWLLSLGPLLWVALLGAGAAAGVAFPRGVRAALTSGLWALTLLSAPMVATYNALRRDWGVWRQHAEAEAPASRPASGMVP